MDKIIEELTVILNGLKALEETREDVNLESTFNQMTIERLEKQIQALEELNKKEEEDEVQPVQARQDKLQPQSKDSDSR